jgi:hypothetical protein
MDSSGDYEDDSKAVYRMFNRAVKYCMRNISELVPDISSSLNNVAMLMKIAKHVGIKWPYKYYNILVHAPYKEQLIARDTLFFQGSHFNVEGFPELTHDIKRVMQTLSEESLNMMWNNIDKVIDATKRVENYRERKIANASPIASKGPN